MLSRQFPHHFGSGCNEEMGKKRGGNKERRVMFKVQRVSASGIQVIQCHTVAVISEAAECQGRQNEVPANSGEAGRGICCTTDLHTLIQPAPTVARSWNFTRLALGGARETPTVKREITI